MRIASLSFGCAILVAWVPAFADPFGYTEHFDSGSNMDWGTDQGWPYDDLLGSNYDEDGAGYSPTGGNGGGYVWANAAVWTPTLIFADSDASGGALAGNKNYSGVPSLGADTKWTGTEGGYVYFFLASTGDSSTNPVGASNLTMFIDNGQWLAPSSDWTHLTADLTDPDQWWAWFGSDDFSGVTADVDLVGAFWYGPYDGEFRMDNFTATPEPGFLLTMAPMAGFLGWRLRHAGKRNPTRRTNPTL